MSQSAGSLGDAYLRAIHNMLFTSLIFQKRFFFSFMPYTVFFFSFQATINFCEKAFSLVNYEFKTILWEQVSHKKNLNHKVFLNFKRCNVN